MFVILYFLTLTKTIFESDAQLATQLECLDIRSINIFNYFAWKEFY